MVDFSRLKSRSARLNNLASVNGAKNYLEIGVAAGYTFKKVNLRRKVAVDPKFLFDTTALASKSVNFHQTTSDDYFSNIIRPEQVFDLIHIDGLHTFEQTLRDFCASLAHSHARSLWLIDDTRPESYAQADRSQERCAEIKKATGESNAKWMGDVFKVVAFIHDFLPQYSFANFPDHGQTVVWRQTRKEFVPLWNSMEAIERLTFADFLAHGQSIYRVESYKDIFTKLATALRK